MHQKPPAWLYLTVRTRGEPSTFFTAIPRVVWSVDKDLPLDGPYLASAWVATLHAGLRLSMVVAWMFAALALVLSMAGLYGLTVHAIEQSTREIGIRKRLARPIVWSRTCSRGAWLPSSFRRCVPGCSPPSAC